MKNKNVKNLRIEHLSTCEPQSVRQEVAFAEWKRNGNHLVLNGSAGTGKTFIALYLALETVLDKSNTINKIHLIRSVVPTREVGFLPGTINEKLSPYITPYRIICADLFENPEAFELLNDSNVIEFHSTSFIRGLTFDDSIIVVDEMQNCTFHELDSILTRVGENSRVIFCGDYYQSDFVREKDKEGIKKFIEIVYNLNRFSIIEFDWSDIVRSAFVRDYIMTKEMLERNGKITAH